MNHCRGKFLVDILWFRRDLRVYDNPLLSIADGYVLPIFIFDVNILQNLRRNDSRVTYLFDAVKRLSEDLKKMGLGLLVLYGRPDDVFTYLSKMFCIKNVYAISDNDSYSKGRDRKIGRMFQLHLINDAFLINPEQVYSSNGNIYTTYSHFRSAVWEKVIERAKKIYVPKKTLRMPFVDCRGIIYIDKGVLKRLPFVIESISFFRNRSRYIGSVIPPERLLDNLRDVVSNYESIRDIPFFDATSHLGCALRFGTISVREVLRRALECKNSSAFINELIWREFFNYLLFHFPESEEKNFRNITVKWKFNEELFEKWKSGETGIPIVDAGMRQLNTEGFIHNRVRMIVASFLTKNLHIDWRYGERHFAELLMDYEVSSNVGNWQWVAGVGADPKSMYRVFNPFLQAIRFDTDTRYIKKYIPELKRSSAKDINSYDFIYKKGIEGYPKPIVDIKYSAKEFRMLIKKGSAR